MRGGGQWSKIIVLRTCDMPVRKGLGEHPFWDADRLRHSKIRRLKP